MQPITTIPEIRKRVASLKEGGKTVAFVPTMGALHEGHLSLVRLAREKADHVVVSIYVNPTQFGPGEDYEDYPRQLQEDMKICEEEGVSAVFSPSDQVMYDDEQYLSIEIDKLTEHMCGASREGHFEGVLLVVNKLFNIIEPDMAVFGQKDIQQYILLERMVKEFNHNIELIMGDIVRANDGLALSSRNKYLSDQQRAVAPGLYRCLRYLKKQVEDEGIRNVKLLVQHQRDELEAKGFEIDYVNVYSYETLEPVKELKKEYTYIVAGAVYLGQTRLIDNMIIEL